MLEYGVEALLSVVPYIHIPFHSPALQHLSDLYSRCFELLRQVFSGQEWLFFSARSQSVL